LIYVAGRRTAAAAPPRATMATVERPTEPLDDELRERIADALRGLKYGVIEIQVHDARVVRITRTEKIMLGTPGPRSK